jgi:pilus assembly protein CpaF
MSSSRRGPDNILRFGQPSELTSFALSLNQEIALRTADGNLTEQIEAYLSERGLRAEASTIEAIRAVIAERREGMGPLADLMADKDVTDVAINHYNDVWYLRSGAAGWSQAIGVSFESEAELDNLIRRVVSSAHRSLDVSDPSVDGRIGENGPRFHAAISPLSPAGPVLTIRKYRPATFTLMELALSAQRSMSPHMASFLSICVFARLNLMVAGGTGSGKTTLLSALLDLVKGDQRMIFIEETAELRIAAGQNVVRLETVSDIEHRTPDEALRDSLRMAPDRIIVGEVRGPEALTMLQAMNTGHEGSMSSIHANGSADALSRLATLARMSGTLPYDAILAQIGSAIHIVAQLRKDPHDGRRFVSEISEVHWDGRDLSTRTLFAERNGDFEAVNRPSLWASQLARWWPEGIPDPWSALEPGT